MDSFELGDEYSEGRMVLEGDGLSGVVIVDGRGGTILGGIEPKLIRFEAAV